MCSRMPVHIPGHCPQLKPGDTGILIKSSPAMEKAIREWKRGIEVRRRYPPGPWPFQRHPQVIREEPKR